MISFMISVVPPKINRMWLNRQSTQSGRSSGLVLPPVKAELYLVSVSPGVSAVSIRSPYRLRTVSIHWAHGNIARNFTCVEVLGGPADARSGDAARHC
jgi:hypothetical protein